MDILQQLLRTVLPRKIQCIEEAQLEEEARNFEEHQDHPHFSLPNPKVPSFEHLLDPIRTVTWHTDHIRGFRFEINLPLSQYFQLTHTWNIPYTTGAVSKNPMKPPPHPTYTLSAQVVRDIQNREPTTVMTARVDNDGKLDAFFIKKLASNVSLRLYSSFLNSNVQHGMFTADIDIENRNNTTGFKLAPGVFNIGHMERITRNLILGFDYTYRSREGMSLFGYAAKYRHRSHHLFLQYSANQAQLSLAYSVPIKKGTMFVSSFTHERQDNKTTTILGLKQKYHNNEIVATINSRAKIATSLSILGGPQAPYSLRLCSIVDYLKDTYKFGYGITIGQAE